MEMEKRDRWQLLTLLPRGLLCVCFVFNSKMAPTFHSPLSLPLLTSAALRFENSDTVVRATAAAQPQPTQDILTLGVLCESEAERCVSTKKPQSAQRSRTVATQHTKHFSSHGFLCYQTALDFLPSVHLCARSHHHSSTD